LLINLLSSKIKGSCLWLLVVCLSLPLGAMAESKTHSKEELEKRLAEIEQHLKKNPHDIDEWESKVATLQLLGRSSEAVQICESEARSGVDRPYIWRCLGVRKYKEKKWEEALPFFKRAERTGDAVSAGFVAYCLRRLGRNDECLKFTSEKIPQYPDQAILYFSRGLARQALQHSKTLVCEDLWKAAQLDPKVVVAYRSICSEEDASK